MIKRNSAFAKIIEVFKDNFIKEIKRISELIDEEYNFIGIDTEYPGIVYSINDYSSDFYYKTLKLNVDALKLIQVGITLCNAKGEFPNDASTWQFNLNFNYDNDKYLPASFAILQNSGIDFKKLKTDGIPHILFAEYLITSGLVLNQEINWVSFHGSYDFAYLLRLLINYDLPSTESEFGNGMTLYFPNHYDIRILVQGNDNLKGGLNKLAQYLEVIRIGNVHQAGSDSIVTIEIYFKLLLKNLINKNNIESNFRNILFGLGVGKDNNETITYTQINHCFYNPYLMPLNTLMMSLSPTNIPIDINGVIPSFIPNTIQKCNSSSNNNTKPREKAKEVFNISKAQNPSMTIL